MLVDGENLIMIDLISFPADSNDQIKNISQSNASNYLVGISDNHSDSAQDEIPTADIDYHFSLDSDPEEFFELITELSSE